MINEKRTFKVKARNYSQDPWAHNGGYMSSVVTKEDIPHRVITEHIFDLTPGEISEVFQSPLGFHFVKRHRVEYRQACMILVTFGDVRTEEKARRIIEEAYRNLRRGMPFPEGVEKYSDGPVEKTKGFTPLIYRGTWIPKLEEKLFSMEIGPVSKPIKLTDAYVIMVRVR